MRGSQRHHAVATQSKPVHPAGQPISASTKAGFSIRAPAQVGAPAVLVGGSGRKGRFTACSFSGRLLRASVAGLAWPLFQSRADGVAQQRARPVRSAERRFPALGRLPSLAFGVGQFRAVVASPSPAFAEAPRRLWLPRRVGVGHAEHEQALASVRRADLLRREQSFRNAEAQALQLAADIAIAEVEVVGDVLEENKSGLALADDAGDMRPEVARVVGAAAAAGDAERLARIARQHEIHRATPCAAVEAGKVVPDRRRRQGLVFHPGHEDGRGAGVPLDVTHSTVSGLGDVQAEIEAAGAGAQRQPEQGPSAASAWGGM